MEDSNVKAMLNYEKDKALLDQRVQFMEKENKNLAERLSGMEQENKSLMERLNI